MTCSCQAFLGQLSHCTSPSPFVSTWGIIYDGCPARFEGSADCAAGVHLAEGLVWPPPSPWSHLHPLWTQLLLLTSVINQLAFSWHLSQPLPHCIYLKRFQMKNSYIMFPESKVHFSCFAVLVEFRYWNSNLQQIVYTCCWLMIENTLWMSVITDWLSDSLS